MGQEQHQSPRSPEEAARLLRERIDYLEKRDLLRLVEDRLKDPERRQRQTPRGKPASRGTG